MDNLHVLNGHDASVQARRQKANEFINGLCDTELVTSALKLTKSIHEISAYKAHVEKIIRESQSAWSLILRNSGRIRVFLHVVSQILLWLLLGSTPFRQIPAWHFVLVFVLGWGVDAVYGAASDAIAHTARAVHSDHLHRLEEKSRSVIYDALNLAIVGVDRALTPSFGSGFARESFGKLRSTYAPLVAAVSLGLYSSGAISYFATILRSWEFFHYLFSFPKRVWRWFFPAPPTSADFESPDNVGRRLYEKELKRQSRYTAYRRPSQSDPEDYHAVPYDYKTSPPKFVKAGKAPAETITQRVKRYYQRGIRKIKSGFSKVRDGVAPVEPNLVDVSKYPRSSIYGTDHSPTDLAAYPDTHEIPGYAKPIRTPPEGSVVEKKSDSDSPVVVPAAGSSSAPTFDEAAALFTPDDEKHGEFTTQAQGTKRFSGAAAGLGFLFTFLGLHLFSKRAGTARSLFEREVNGPRTSWRSFWNGVFLRLRHPFDYRNKINSADTQLRRVALTLDESVVDEFNRDSRLATDSCRAGGKALGGFVSVLFLSLAAAITSGAFIGLVNANRTEAPKAPPPPPQLLLAPIPQ